MPNHQDKIKALIGETARLAEITRTTITLKYEDRSYGKEVLGTDTNDVVEKYQNRIEVTVTAEPLKLSHEH